MILRRYILTRVASQTIFVLLAALMLLIIIDVMGVSQQLTRGTLYQVLRLYFLRLPEFVINLLPAALVLGPLLAMGSLAKHFELTAIKFTGGSMLRVVAPPFAITGVSAGLLLFFLSEIAMPLAYPKAVRMQNGIFKLRGPRYWSFYYPRRWMRTPQGFLHAERIRRSQVSGVTYIRHDDAFAPILLVRAEQLKFKDGAYQLLDGISRDLSERNSKPERFSQMLFPEPVERGALVQRLGYPEVFSMEGLVDAVAVHSSQGGKVAPFKLALWRRIADPLLLLVIALAIVPIAAWSRRGQPTERRLIEGAFLIGLFFLIRGSFGALATAETSWCLLAAFGPIGAFALLGGLLWLRVEKESLLS